MGLGWIFELDLLLSESFSKKRELDILLSESFSKERELDLLLSESFSKELTSKMSPWQNLPESLCNFFIKQKFVESLTKIP